MPHEHVTLQTRDGGCPVKVLTPAVEDPRPAVISYNGSGGIRPGEVAMAQRLADAGYIMLLPDLFYR